MDIKALEDDLRAYRPGTPGAAALHRAHVWPRYEGRCVANLAATMAGALGASVPGALPSLAPDLTGDLLDGVQRVILLVMDALGWLQLRRVMTRYDDVVFHRLAEQGRLVPITTTFLSTTDSVLSSIWTGRPPSQHGLLAFELYLREWMMAVEAIGFSSPFEPFSNTLLRWGFEPEQFLPVPSVGQALSGQGITTVTVTHKQFTTSPLSLMHHRGVTEVRGHNDASDFWLQLRRALHDHRGKRLLLAGYWSAVDTLGHKFGPEDESGEMEVRAISMLMDDIFLKRLDPALGEKTLLLMTADHGQILTRRAVTPVMAEHPQLMDMLWMPPLGEGRVPFFYVRNGMYDAVWDYLHAHFGDIFVFMSREQVLESGLLGPGPLYAEVPFRVGDIVGIAREDGSVVADFKDLDRLAGRHGGLSPEEMLVPLLAVRLDA